MSITKAYKVESIDSYLVKDWCLHKHYSKRVPNSLMYTFGLFNAQKKMQGVCIFGSPSARGLNAVEGIKCIELTRLILNDGHEPNLTSFFVSQSLKQIKEDALLIVSFADSNQNHNGYIYQATNWIYTGKSGERKSFFINGREVHERTIVSRFGTSSEDKLKEKLKDFGAEDKIEIKKQQGKHRYFYIIGSSKKTKQRIKKALSEKYSVLPYPKGENSKYDASYTPILQGRLF